MIPIDTIIIQKEWSRMNQYLMRLSNMEFRKAETHIRNHTLPSLPDGHYWEALHQLIVFKRQAFLSGLFSLGQRECLNFDLPEAVACLEYIQSLGPELTVKALNIILPSLTTKEQADLLFKRLHTITPEQRVNSLLKTDTPLSYFLLFKYLKHLDHKPEVIHKCAIILMRRNTDLSFNMAYILKVYFGLSGLKGNFSLSIQPYELNYLDRNLETFNEFIEGKRPKIHIS